LIQITRNAKSSTTISRLTELEEHAKVLQMKLSLSEKEIVSLKIQLEDTKSYLKVINELTAEQKKNIEEIRKVQEEYDSTKSKLVEVEAKLDGM
jgi:DNA repair exonuclease SbcCD ATPase subunit